MQAADGGDKDAEKDDEDDDDDDLAEDVDENRQQRVNWFIAGTAVCRRAFLKMMGLSSGRLQGTRQNFEGLDRRSLPGPGRRLIFCLQCDVNLKSCRQKAEVVLSMENLLRRANTSGLSNTIGHGLLSANIFFDC